MSKEAELLYSSHLFSSPKCPSYWQELNTAESESARSEVYATHNVINSQTMKSSVLNNVEQREEAS